MKMKTFKGLLLTLGFMVFGPFALAGERKELSETIKKEVRAMLEANEGLHASFFEYDGEKIEKNAKKLSAKIDDISDDSIRQILKFSQEQLAKMSAESEREKNDQKYHVVSMALIHLVNTYNVGEGYNAYSCPMVEKKWVQNSKKMDRVHNPFHPGMKHCGTKDTKF